MAVRKICTLKGCRASPRCEHPWWFDVMHQGKRWRMSVDRFALARGATEPIEAKQTAERVWEPKFLGEIAAGRDPPVPPTTQRAAVGLTVAEFLDLYYTNYVEAEGLRDPVTIMGRLKAIKATLGDLPVTALEKPTEVLRFKAAYRKGREVATLNRALSTLRAAIMGSIPGSAVPHHDAVPQVRREQSRQRRKRNAIVESDCRKSRRFWRRARR